MPEENIDQLVFSSFLKINYDIRFIKVVQDFASNLAELSGGNKEEILQIRILIEESLMFIINKYIDSRLAAHIEIVFNLYENGIINMKMTDTGPPIHEDKIPDFDFNNENTESGLWYKLVTKLSDKFEFVNRFNKGWLINIEKKLANTCFKSTDINASDIDTSGKKIIRQAVPDDAPQLVDLAFMTYRYSNGIPEFYDAESLKKHIEEKLYDVFVVEHKNKIVGAISVKYYDLNSKSAEVSSAMVAPEYRNSTAIRLIMKKITEYHKLNPRNCDFFVSYAVTTHDRSQKLLSRVYKGYKFLSISLNMIPRPEYIGLKGKIYSRESLANYYHIYNKLKINKMYVPERHYETIKELLANIENEITLLTDTREPETENTEIFHFSIEQIKSSIVSINSFGNDWLVCLTKKILSLISGEIETILINVNTLKPLPENFDNTMKNMNIFFTGLSLYSIDKLDLTYSFTIKEIDFNSIKLENPVAKKILSTVEEDYKSVGRK